MIAADLFNAVGERAAFAELASHHDLSTRCDAIKAFYESALPQIMDAKPGEWGIDPFEVYLLRWRESGAVATEPKASPEGYLRLQVDAVRYWAHRVVWLVHYGQWPQHSIDHIDGNKQHNAISNLRDVPQAVNAQNVRRAPRSSLSGVLGASWDPATGRWLAAIRINGKRKNLGRFATPEEAHQAYLAAKRRHHEGCTL